MADKKKQQRQRPARQTPKKQGFADVLKRRKHTSDAEFKPDAQAATWI